MFVRLFAAEPVTTGSKHPTVSKVVKQRAECIVDGWVIPVFGRSTRSLEISARSFYFSERDEVDRGVIFVSLGGKNGVVGFPFVFHEHEIDCGRARTNLITPGRTRLWRPPCFALADSSWNVFYKSSEARPLYVPKPNHLSRLCLWSVDPVAIRCAMTQVPSISDPLPSFPRPQHLPFHQGVGGMSLASVPSTFLFVFL